MIFSTAHAASESEEDTYDQDSILDEAVTFFGEGAKGIGEAVEKAVGDHGRPIGYIKGTKVSGALIVGARYGDGNLHMKRGARRKVHWAGPSMGFDAGLNYHRADDIVPAPIRLGAGLRSGVNVDYMHYSRKKSWNPF